LTHYLADHKKNELFPASLLHSALFSLSLFYEMRCRSLEAISILNESANFLRGKRAEFERTNDACEIRSLIGHVIAYLGLHHFYVVKYDQGREYLEEALTWLEDDLSKVVRAQVQVMLASAKDIFGELRESAALLEKSREVFREQDINWWYALSTSHLAASYLSLGRYDESEELFIEALRLIKPGDLRVSVTARSAYGVLLFIRNNFAKSEEILLENLQHAYRLGNNRQTAYNLSYLGRVALATNRVELAETYLQQALNILKEFGESQEVGMLYIHIGKCYYAKADHNAARDKFWQAIKIGQDLNKYHQVYYGLVNIARTYAKEGQTEKALEIFLLLMQSPVEYIRMKADYDLLRADLQAALPAGKMDSILAQMDGEISQETARADVLEYVKNHANG
jgi:tetratricopeptide (TPR) repeat protein